MKKYLPLVVCFLIAPAIASAQPYLRGGFGYGLSLGSSRIATSTNSVSSVTSYEELYGSYGEGFTLGAAFGLPLYSHIKGELGISYTIGTSFKENDMTPQGLITRVSTGSLFSVTPSVLVTTQIGEVEPFARVGCIIGIPTLKIEESGYDNDKEEYSGNIALGFTGGLGVIIPLRGKLSFCGELSFTNIAWGPNEYTYTNWPSGETGTVQLKESFNENEQNTEGAPSIPFGTIGVTVGLVLTLR